jgi:hypothetical protein
MIQDHEIYSQQSLNLPYRSGSSLFLSLGSSIAAAHQHHTDPVAAPSVERRSIAAAPSSSFHSDYAVRARKRDRASSALSTRRRSPDADVETPDLSSSPAGSDAAIFSSTGLGHNPLVICGNPRRSPRLQRCRHSPHRRDRSRQTLQHDVIGVGGHSALLARGSNASASTLRLVHCLNSNSVFCTSVSVHMMRCLKLNHLCNNACYMKVEVL